MEKDASTPKSSSSSPGEPNNNNSNSSSSSSKGLTGLPVAKTKAEFKAYRMNRREQSRLDIMQAYLCRQERYCHKEFRSSILKVQTHFKKRFSAAATAFSPSLSTSRHLHHHHQFPTPFSPSHFLPHHHKTPQWRRASAIPASSGHSLTASLLPEGLMPDKLQMRRQTYGGGAVLSPASLAPHRYPAFGGDRRKDIVVADECPVCPQLREMMLFHLKENCGDSRNVTMTGPHKRNDRLDCQDVPSFTRQRYNFLGQRQEVVSPRNREGNPHLQCEEFHLDGDEWNRRSVKSGGLTAAVMSETAPASAKTSPRAERRSEQVEVPLITVLDTDSAAPYPGRKSQQAPRFKATGEGVVVSRADDPTNATDQGAVSRMKDGVHAPGTSSTRFIRYTKPEAIAVKFNKLADDVLRKNEESRDIVRTASDENKRDIQNGANRQAEGGSVRRDVGGVRKRGVVSMTQASSQRKPSLTPPNLTSPNKVKFSVPVVRDRMRSSSLADPHRTKTASLEVKALSTTRTTRSASLTLPTQPSMGGSFNPSFPNQLSTPFSNRASPNKTSEAAANTSAYDDVTFDDIILQHAKTCPSGERECTRRNSAILHSVQRTPSTVLSSPRSTSSTAESPACSTKPIRSTSAVMWKNSRQAIHSLASSNLSKPSRTSSAAVLQNSRRTLNSQAFPAHSSGRMGNSVSAFQDTSMKSDTATAATISTVVSRPLEGKVVNFLQQQSEFNKRFPLKDYEVKSLECVRPDLVPKSRDQKIQQLSKEKRRMITEVMDILGLAGIETLTER